MLLGYWMIRLMRCSRGGRDDPSVSNLMRVSDGHNDIVCLTYDIVSVLRCSAAVASPDRGESACVSRHCGWPWALNGQLAPHS